MRTSRARSLIDCSTPTIPPSNSTPSRTRSLSRQRPAAGGCLDDLIADDAAPPVASGLAVG